MSNANRLSEREILLLVNDYIGSPSEGYLTNFSYKTHEEFYGYYCDLSVNVVEKRKIHGTTRKTFIAILQEVSPAEQARIVEGVFQYFEDRDKRSPSADRDSVRAQLQSAVARIRNGPSLALPDLRSAGNTVIQAIRDATILLTRHGSTNAFDRVHTAFHGYLRCLCGVAGVSAGKPNPSPAELWGALKKSAVFAAMYASQPEGHNFERLHSTLGGIVSATETLRNRTSLAHPNEELIPPDEASLAIDAMSAMVNYLNRKFAQ
jgi:hypothetical protein